MYISIKIIRHVFEPQDDSSIQRTDPVHQHPHTCQSRSNQFQWLVKTSFNKTHFLLFCLRL